MYDFAYWLFFSFAAIPYILGASAPINTTNSYTRWMLYLACFAWSLLFSPFIIHWLFWLCVSSFEVIVTNLILLIITDMLLEQTPTYTLSLNTVLGANSIIVVISSFVYLSYILLSNYGNSTTPETPQHSVKTANDDNTAISSISAFKMIDNNYLENLSLFLSVVGSVITAMVSIIRRFVNKKHMHIRYKDNELIVMLSSICISAILLKTIMSFWNIVVNRVLIWTTLFLCITMRRPVCRISYNPLQRDHGMHNGVVYRQPHFLYHEHSNVIENNSKTNHTMQHSKKMITIFNSDVTKLNHREDHVEQYNRDFNLVNTK